MQIRIRRQLNQLLGDILWHSSVLWTLVFCLTASHCLHARALDTPNVVLWQPSPADGIFVLPREAGDTENQAVQRYLQTAETDILIKNTHPDRWKFLKFGKIKGSVLLAANDPADHNIHDKTTAETLDQITANGLQYVILPVGATANMTRDERRHFHSSLAKVFNKLILMGGNDLAPSTYGQVGTYARNYNAFRDQMEIDLVTDFYNYGQGKVLGICRGAQLLAVAFGGQLYQDIKEQLGSTVDHSALHKITIVPSDNRFGKYLGLQKDKSVTMIWNSYHHQAIHLKKDGIFTPVAFSEDGVVEAMISKDGRMIGIQTHFERADPAGQGTIFLKNWLGPSVNSQEQCTEVFKFAA